MQTELVVQLHCSIKILLIIAKAINTNIALKFIFTCGYLRDTSDADLTETKC